MNNTFKACAVACDSTDLFDIFSFLKLSAMRDITTIRLSGYLPAAFLFFALNVFGQYPGQAPSTGNPPQAGQPPKIANPEAAAKLPDPEEIRQKNEANNEKTTKKLADFIDALLRAVKTPGDPKTKEILLEAQKNQNLRKVIDILRKYPADQDLIYRLKQMLLDNPTQDPAKKVDSILKGYNDQTVPPDVQQRRKQLLERLGPELRRTMLTVTAKGTGNTTGHIANLSVDNPTQSYLVTSPQSVFIPSDGQYQPYVGTIPGTLLPPGISTIPVDGYCADVHTPPVPSGSPMPPLDTWIPVGVTDEIPEGEDFPIIGTTPIPPFVPEDIPDIVNTPGFTPMPPDAEQDIIITWPGTDIPVGGTLDPDEDPTVFAPVIVKVMEEVEDAAESITESGILTTPFSPDPPRQIQASVQQVVWIFAAGITGEEYGKTDFTDKVYEQFEDNSGNAVTTLPEEQKEKLDSGVDDFWDVFTAVGVEAKVISDKSPGIDLDPTVLATVSTPGCKCNNISYDLEVKRAGVVVHSDSHTTPRSPKVAIDDFEYGDSLEVKITNIRANCNCEDAECLFYPAQSTKTNSSGYTTTDLTRPGKADIEISDDGANVASENNNASLHEPGFNDDGTEYTFGLKVKDEKSNEKSVFQKLKIKAYCELPDCRRALCKKTVQLNFVTAN
ncbi:MAG TPA: hypothetical protein VLA46_12670 [Saprospiraceae bacterium]|nr:hypothetical protein [Saprospiraceae bacterium]